MKTDVEKQKEEQERMKYEIAEELGLPHGRVGGMNVPYTNAYLGGPVGGLMTKELVTRGEALLMEQKKYKD